MAAIDEDDRSEVLILGAGFSRSISPSLPLTDDLGNLAVAAAGVVDDRRVPADGFRDGRFEIWLSRLASDQPHLGTAENLDNRALFSRVAQGIGDVLEEVQLEVLEGSPPDWLCTLLSVLHVRRTRVITLNYDTLVECAMDTHHLWDREMNQRAMSHDILNDLPPRPSSAYRFNGSVAATFRLLKLHGSLRWYWNPADAAGTTLQRWETPGTFGDPSALDDDQRRRSLPGREPFIVPPAATKSTYQHNVVTRELWSQAFEALRTAGRVVLVGYSLPSADVALSGMIEDAIRERDVSFEVVNLHPDDVIERLENLGVPAERITQVSGDDCVEAYVNRTCADEAERLVRRLRQLPETDPSAAGLVLVAWSNAPSLTSRLVYAVTDILPADPETGEVILRLTGAEGSSPGVPLAPVPEQVGKLLHHLSTARTLVAVTPQGRRAPIIDVSLFGQALSEGVPSMSLVPAGRPDA